MLEDSGEEAPIPAVELIALKAAPKPSTVQSSLGK
jgi:hypothetical protein